MRYARLIILSLLLVSRIFLYSQQHTEKKGQEVPTSFCISQMDFKLFTMINEYRAQFDLPAIPLSKSLCYVASLHVRDLYMNHSDKGPCNSHSWSANGPWKPFCYPRDENKKNSVWDKPKELTLYKGKGYEIVYWENSSAVIDSVVAFWKSMEYFNSFLMNTGTWTGKKWEAIGISIYKNYALAWFGEIPDPEGQPVVCGTVSPEAQKKADAAKAETPKGAIPAAEVSKQQGKVQGPATPGKGDAGKTQGPKKTQETHVAVDSLKTPSGRYYIVVKSLGPKSELVKMLDSLKRSGYPNARLIEKDGKKRLSAADFTDKPAADSALKEMKKSFRDAWIFKY